MNSKPLFHLLTTLTLLLAILPIQAVQAALVESNAPTDLLQFAAGEHALGFAAGSVYAATGSHALHVDFVNANRVQPQSDTPTSLQGQAASLSRVTYADLWQGITLTYTAGAGSIYTTTYSLEPGADPADIHLHYNAPLTKNEDGTLSIDFETGTMAESAPIAWQEIQGQRVPVDATSRVSGQDVGFILDSYDPHFALMIDPNLTWNTFLGASGEDKGTGITIDGGGNVYVTGGSCATWGSPMRAYSGGCDAFVARFDSAGSLTWSTFLGGAGFDYGRGIAVDGSGSVYVTGDSTATWGSPVRPYTSSYDAFATQLNSSTGTLTWNTFLGGTATDYACGIVVDGSNVYVTGFSNASWGSPVRAYTGGWDAFAAKLGASGGLWWETFLGGGGFDYGYGIAVDGDGNVYVTGHSGTSWGSPMRPYTGGYDAFAAQLNSAGLLIWNTFLGGSGEDRGYGIDVDGTGIVYVTGYSDATWGSPVRTYGGGSYDCFAAKLTSAGMLTWNTFLGGSGSDQGTGIAVDGIGNVYVTGKGDWTWGIPVRSFTIGGNDDSFAAKLNSSTGALTWNTFLGGSGSDQGTGIAVDGSNVYVTGFSNASWEISPVRSFAGGWDALAAKLDSAGSLTWNTFLGGSGSDQGTGIAVDGSGYVYVTGHSDSTWGNPVYAFAGGNDAFAAKLDSAGNLIWSTFLGGSGSDQGNGIAVDGSNVYVAGNSDATWGSPVRAFASGTDAFAAKLNPSTGALTWNTFLGGGLADQGTGIAVDGGGNIYVTGYSYVTWGSPVHAFAGGNDAFAAKLGSAGSLIWNTFLGGSGNDQGYGIAADASNVYVTGTSAATWGIPVQAYGGGGNDGFAAKINLSTGALVWSTFLGGSGNDQGRGITIDGSGNAYVMGYSGDPWGSPVRSYTGGNDAFVAKLDSSGALTWSTFLGGSAPDQGYGIAVDGHGNVYGTGNSFDTWGSPAHAHAGLADVFVVRLNSVGSLTWSTFLGGTGSDYGDGIAMDGSGSAYLTGRSYSTWGSPVRAYAGGVDAFVAKVEFPPSIFLPAILR
jgi:hypothetical protein